MSFLKTFFGSSREKTSAAVTSPLDLVTSTVSLASDPPALDPLLDSVRTLTARLQPGAALTPSDETILLGVYLEIEKYLMTNDPIRSFTQGELRGRIGPELLVRLQRYEKQPKHGVQ